jgi:hypothetical protein
MTTIIEILGDPLSEALNIKPIQAKGLLRLAIKDVMPNKNIEHFSLKDITMVLNEGLDERLNKIGVPNSKNLVKDLISYITENQSLLTIIRT